MLWTHTDCCGVDTTSHDYQSVRSSMRCGGAREVSREWSVGSELFCSDVDSCVGLIGESVDTPTPTIKRVLTQSRRSYLEACEDYRPTPGLVYDRSRELGVKHSDARMMCNGICLSFGKAVEQLLLRGGCKAREQIE